MSRSPGMGKKTYQSTFEVKSGMDHDVEVVAQESGATQGPALNADVLHAD